jgi:hypothetical protein
MSEFESGINLLRNVYSNLSNKHILLQDEFSKSSKIQNDALLKAQEKIEDLNLKLSEAQNSLSLEKSRNLKLNQEKNSIILKYNELKKTTLTLESFRKSIVNMVHEPTYSSQDIPQEELTVGPILEDPSVLYRNIRDQVSPTDFEVFADTVSMFNAGNLGPFETIERVKGIINDKKLIQDFEKMVMDAIQ